MIDTNTSRNIPPAHTHPGQSAATTNAATVHPILTKYFATDGAYMDDVKKVLYVSEVYGHKVIAVSIDNTSNVREFTAPGMLSLDDFTLSEVRRLQAQASTCSSNRTTTQLTQTRLCHKISIGPHADLWS